MIYFDSDMSKSTNTVVYFDWKTLIYIYTHNLCNSNNTAPSIGIIRVKIYAANGKVSHIHRRMCWWDYTEWITRSFVNKAKEGGYVRIIDISNNISHNRTSVAQNVHDLHTVAIQLVVFINLGQ
jgi:hypothetical protein